MKPAITVNEKPLEDIDPHEFDPMIADTLSQLESFSYNETADVSLDVDEFGIDGATD